MELLDIQIDLFHFKGLLDSIGTENQENTQRTVVVLYFQIQEFPLSHDAAGKPYAFPCGEAFQIDDCLQA